MAGRVSLLDDKPGAVDSDQRWWCEVQLYGDAGNAAAMFYLLIEGANREAAIASMREIGKALVEAPIENGMATCPDNPKT